jgi:hypothetical protein
MDTRDEISGLGGARQWSLSSPGGIGGNQGTLLRPFLHCFPSIEGPRHGRPSPAVFTTLLNDDRALLLIDTTPEV